MACANCGAQLCGCSEQPFAVEALRLLLDYDPATGAFSWRSRDEGLFKAADRTGLRAAHRSWNKKYAGQPVRTTLDGKGYHRIRLLGKSLPAHRAAFAIAHGRWPAADIDHLDGDRANNKLANLREVSRALNSRNKHVPTRAASGVPGVFWRERDRRWVAVIGVDGRGRHLGQFASMEEAIAVREQAERALGYRPGHCRLQHKASNTRPSIPTGDRDGAGSSAQPASDVNAVSESGVAFAVKAGPVAPLSGACA